MIVNTKWLSQYTEIPFSHEELADRLTHLGVESKTQKRPIDGIAGVIVAEILDVLPHPNADRLTICKVLTGTRELSVVCGAPNVKKGLKVPLALSGTELPNGIKVKAAKIRGIFSEGIIYAEDELGLSDDHSGVMILNKDAPPGIGLSDYFAGFGANIDIDLTPNRPDCLSHIGVAREITLLTGKELKIPEIRVDESDIPIEEEISVEIKNIHGCPRYAARVIKGVEIADSPEWLTNYLSSVGIRSINNVVDAANYVLMETGHPLHTFDYSKIKGQKIVVRSAEDGERVETLEGTEYTLCRDVLLICDAEHPVAIAGIMGLSNSEITSDTKDILIESAYFDPPTIRKGSKYLGLSTEASYRFERGVDPECAIFALNRVTQLIVEVAGGKLCRGLIDEYPRSIASCIVDVRFNQITKLLGIEIDRVWIEDKFKKLGCKILKTNDNSVELVSPSWRPDLTREVDYIEEVVRIFGMENVPSVKRFVIQPTFEYSSLDKMIETLRSMLSAYGYYEVYNNSLTHKRHTQFIFEPIKAIKIRNPLSQDMAYLRTTLIPGLVQTAKYNMNRREYNLQLFEMGYVQYFDPSSETKARESLKFSLLVTGNIEEKHWNFSPQKGDLFILKGTIEDIVKRFGTSNLEYEMDKHAYFRHLLKITLKGRVFGYLGQISQDYLEKQWDIESPIFVLEADASVLFDNSDFEIKYQALLVYPAVERDVSILIPEDVSVEKVKQKIVENGGQLLKDVRFYDLYKGKNIDKYLKSFTFNLVFQTAEKTLTDKEIDKVVLKIHKGLIRDLKAKLR